MKSTGGADRSPLIKTDPDELLETRVEGERLFSGAVFDLEVDRVKLPNGRIATRELIRHKGAVAIVPLFPDGTVAVEEQFRYAVGRIMIEIPAGKLDAPDEDRLSAAQRELMEETGYTADEWTEIGDFHPAPAYSDEYITMYLARGLHKGERHLDADEFLDVYTVPLKDLADDVMAGRISDAKTQVAILKAARILNI